MIASHRMIGWCVSEATTETTFERRCHAHAAFRWLETPAPFRRVTPDSDAYDKIL